MVTYRHDRLRQSETESHYTSFAAPAGINGRTSDRYSYSTTLTQRAQPSLRALYEIDVNGQPEGFGLQELKTDLHPVMHLSYK